MQANTQNPLRQGAWLSVVVHSEDARERRDTALHTIDSAIQMLNDARLQERSVGGSELSVVTEMLSAGYDAMAGLPANDIGLAATTGAPAARGTERQEVTLHAEDRLSAALNKLVAMSAAMGGERFDHFKNLSDDIQANYIWAVRDLIDEAARAHEELTA